MSQQLIQEQADVKFKLAALWLAEGKLEQSIAGFQSVLKLQPNHQQARLNLDYALQQQKRQAQYHQTVSQTNIGMSTTSNPGGKISVVHQKAFVAHRCGWNYAIWALQPLHNDQGILFDGFLENSFIWKHYQPGQVKVPYAQPWVGFLHNPPAMPGWFHPETSPQTLFRQDNWKQSLDYCVGLFCLSEYHARWLREQTSKPVSSLIYPTEIVDQQFEFDRFIENTNKKVIQLGWWLRKLNAIYHLPIARGNFLNYKKIKLNPAFNHNSETLLKHLGELEKQAEGLTFKPEYVANTQEISHVSNQEYDTLLSENIGFTALYDASANTAIVECIARATPLLVNPLPAVVEYLGKEYPMYFDDLSEAARKAMDLGLIRTTHEYLKDCDTRKKLSARYFRESFISSEVYQQIKL